MATATIPVELLTSPQKSMRFYATILRLVQIERRTASQVSTLTGRTPRNVITTMRRMADLRLLHEAEYQQTSPYGPPVAVYAYGPGERAAVPPRAKPRIAPNKWTKRPDLVAFSNVMHALFLGAHSRADLCALSGLHRHSIHGLLAHCHAIGLARITDYERSIGGPFTPLWAIGSTPHRRPPPPKSSADICRNYRRERKAARQAPTAVLAAALGLSAARQQA